MMRVFQNYIILSVSNVKSTIPDFSRRRRVITEGHYRNHRPSVIGMINSQCVCGLIYTRVIVSCFHNKHNLSAVGTK